MNVLLRGSTTQRVRLISGLILFAFALTHFLNHAVGLISVEAMEDVQQVRLAITRSLPGGIILGAALLAHMSLALLKLARRETLRLPPWEWLQILLGLAIPFWLFPHIVNTRFANLFLDIQDRYVYELIWLWPAKGWTHSALLLIVWMHGCLGLHFWLRLTPWYPRAFPALLSMAVLVPVLSLLGFVSAGRATRLQMDDPFFFEDIKRLTNWPDASELQSLINWGSWSKYAFYCLLALVLLTIIVRWIARTRIPKISVTYDPEPTVTFPGGPTLLEVSRMNNIPHISVCGGRARCSTCRVEILDGIEHLPPPEGAEAATLADIHAGPTVRLACQLRPTEPVTVNVMLRPHGRPKKSQDAQGVERPLAVLFLDIRGFTNMSQDKLPYDVVFILNRMFAAIGQAIQQEGGWIDKYLGDGLMAVFGRDSGPEAGCQQALRAARRIDLALDKVNADLESELKEPLRIGMGIHVGPLVLGAIGHDHTAAMTVIGRTVNAAARLEAATKDMKCQVALSAEVARQAGVDLSAFETRSISVRGLDEPLDVIAVRSGRDLPTV